MFEDVKPPIILDLFCGAGGMSLGFKLAGYSVGVGVDSDSLACSTYAHNLADVVCEDIRNITNPRDLLEQHGLASVDVVVGGPPCQGFSRVGRGRIRHQRKDPGFIHDARNRLYSEFFRFVAALRPLYFVMENVPDMQFYNDGEQLVLATVHAMSKDMGYRSEAKVLRADYFGVPQTRQRLFVIGNRLGNPIAWPRPTHARNPVSVWEAIGDLPIIPHGFREDDIAYCPRQHGRYQWLMRQGMAEKGMAGRLFNHQTRWHNEQDLEAFETMEEGGRYVDLPPELQRYRSDIFHDRYRKLYRHLPSWTLEAHLCKDTYRHIFPSRVGEAEPPRTISVREAARLQSFPDRFRFLGAFTRQFHQVGNAVPPLLARAIASAIRPDVTAVSWERLA